MRQLVFAHCSNIIIANGLAVLFYQYQSNLIWLCAFHQEGVLFFFVFFFLFHLINHGNSLHAIDLNVLYIRAPVA